MTCVVDGGRIPEVGFFVMDDQEATSATQFLRGQDRSGQNQVRIQKRTSGFHTPMTQAAGQA